MNCEDFNKIIHELADYKPMQATTRDAGVSHIALCADCAAKLVGARAVSTSLVVAAGAESEEAPIKIKENLMAAFASLNQSGTFKPHGIQAIPGLEVVGKSAAEISVVDVSMSRRRRLWTAAAVAIAAVILLAVVLPNWRKTSAPGLAPPFKDLKAGGRIDSRTPDTVDPKPVAPIGKEIPEATIAAVKPAPVGRRLLKQRRPQAASASGTYQTLAQNTNEYMPLTYLAKATAMDSGTIVRVELSRSALASLGLRMNFEGTDGLVKADVVMGDDGVAQAIRLVQ
jgi:hypothetical protein